MMGRRVGVSERCGSGIGGASVMSGARRIGIPIRCASGMGDTSEMVGRRFRISIHWALCVRVVNNNRTAASTTESRAERLGDEDATSDSGDS